MSQNRKWLLLPPAAALLLVLGPLSMQPTAQADPAMPTAPAAEPTAPVLAQTPESLPAAVDPVAAETPDPKRPSLPKTPDLWQVASTLIGLLLLAGTGLFLLRRVRQGPRGNSTGIVTLRQSVRLSPKNALHAIEFEGRVLLVGEGERGVQLVQSGHVHDAAADEATIAARSTAQLTASELTTAIDDSDGAVPKNLVIPRPEEAPQHIPQQPQAPSQESASPILHDFRSLLAKVER